MLSHGTRSSFTVRRQASRPAAGGWLWGGLIGLIALLWSLAPALHAWETHDVCAGGIAQAHLLHAAESALERADHACEHEHDAEPSVHLAFEENSPTPPAPNSHHQCSTCDLILVGSAMGSLAHAQPMHFAVHDSGQRMGVWRECGEWRSVAASRARGPPKA
jgi:hypothetical protein